MRASSRALQPARPPDHAADLPGYDQGSLEDSLAQRTASPLAGSSADLRPRAGQRLPDRPWLFCVSSSSPLAWRHLSAAEEDPAPQPALVPPPALPVQPLPRLPVRPVVLAIDDDPVLLELLVQAFAEALPDVELRAASTAGEAERAALTWTPQLILCDVRLPDEDGRHLLARLRPRPGLAEVPSVLMTALDISTGVLREQAAALHAELLRRPVERPDLRRVVGRALSQALMQ
jgi:CheY-like chemotaxis protein